MTILYPPKKTAIIEINGKGRGVVCTEDISIGEEIETCPLIFLSEKEADFIVNHSDILKVYALELTAIKRHVLHLGFGLLYNHDACPNAEIQYNVGNYYLSLVAIKPIQVGEEITYDYQFAGQVDFLSEKEILPCIE